MSVQALNWARQMGSAAKLPPGQLVLLWMMADRANKQWACWDGVDTLAREAYLNEKTVRRHLQALEDKGIITRYERRGEFRDPRTRVLYSNVRLSDYIVLEEEALARFQAIDDQQKVPEDPFESPSGTIIGLKSKRDIRSQEPAGTDANRGAATQADNLSGRSRGQETPLPDKLSGRHLTPVDNSPVTEETPLPGNLSGRGGLPDISEGVYRTLQDDPGQSGSFESRTRNKNPHKNPQSSSMSSSATTAENVPSAGAEADQKTTKNERDPRQHDSESHQVRFGTCRVSNARGEVDLDKLVALVAGHWTVTLDRDRAVWLAEAIIGRSARTVGSPDAFVRRSLVNDGPEWQAAVMDHFSDRINAGRSGGHSSSGDRKCPIKHHADSGWSARSCPGCRKQFDFPKQLDRAIYDALDADVRSLVDRDQTVTVVDMTGPSVRSRDRSDRTDDRDAG